jgi:Leucine-rich repeat (LRR) protein
MKHLKTLSLADNGITVFPVALCQLSKLDVLDLSGNSISELPVGCGR